MTKRTTFEAAVAQYKRRKLTPKGVDAKAVPLAAELKTVKLGENGSPLVPLNELLSFVEVEYLKEDMIPYTGEIMYVRKELLGLISLAYMYLQEYLPYATFLIRYAYRHPDVQRLYYERRYQALRQEFPGMSEAELTELTHTQVAFPEVAGHPTGGAIDLTIQDVDGWELDMGTGIADYSDLEKCFTYSTRITRVQARNRYILKEVMLRAGFINFEGEWWHFSYGDREWAFLSGKSCSLFSPIDFKKK